NTFTVSGNVSNGANLLTVGGSGNTTISGGLGNGAGGLTKTGAGTLTLTGNNTYTGTTTISAGILAVGNGGATGDISASANVVNNAALSFSRSNAVSYGDVISGTGALAQAGGGTLTLTGNNTYSGTTTISAGTLSVGNGGTTGSISSSANIV